MEFFMSLEVPSTTIIPKPLGRAIISSPEARDTVYTAKQSLDMEARTSIAATDSFAASSSPSSSSSSFLSSNKMMVTGVHPFLRPPTPTFVPFNDDDDPASWGEPVERKATNTNSSTEEPPVHGFFSSLETEGGRMDSPSASTPTHDDGNLTRTPPYTFSPVPLLPIPQLYLGVTEAPETEGSTGNNTIGGLGSSAASSSSSSGEEVGGSSSSSSSKCSFRTITNAVFDCLFGTQNKDKVV